MAPARERFERVDPPGGDGDGRLVEDDDLPPLQGLLEIEGERMPLAHRFVETRLVRREPPRAFRLGGVHGEIGLCEELVR